MKENEAPKKIYLFEGEPILSARSKKREDASIEYTRTDAFIEKACDAYCKVCGHYAHSVPNHICRQACDYFKDFRKYMEDKL